MEKGALDYNAPRVATRGLKKRDGEDTPHVQVVRIGTDVTRIAKDAFDGYFCETPQSYSAATAIYIPSSVVEIEQPDDGISLFNGCVSLMYVEMNASVTSIPSGTFLGCTLLENVVLPSGLTSIPSGAFYSCGNLKSVTIPSSVTSIGEAAFQAMSATDATHGFGIDDLVIPVGVESIGSNAFLNQHRLQHITFEGKTMEEVQEWLDPSACRLGYWYQRNGQGYELKTQEVTVTCSDGSYKLHEEVEQPAPTPTPDPEPEEPAE